MADPLRLFIESTHKFGHLSADTLTLCAHDRPFYGLHEPLAQLREHHEERLQAAGEECDTPTHDIDTLPELFPRKHDQLGNASMRERWCKYVNIPVVPDPQKTKTK